MNVKPPNAHYAITTLAAYQRTVRIILQRTTPQAPVSPAHVVNFTDIRTPATMNIIRYKQLAGSFIKDKGIFVNVWA
jgi:hypothetical protein